MVRIKYRYLLVNIHYPGSDNDAFNHGSHGKVTLPWSIRFRRPTADSLDARTLSLLVRKGVDELFGDYGAGMIAGSLVVKYFSAATSTAIIRVARAHYRLVWAALTFMTTLPTGEACVLQVVRVSGTIRKSEEEAIRRARSVITNAKEGPKQSLSPRVAAKDLLVNDSDHMSGIEDADETGESEDDV